MHGPLCCVVGPRAHRRCRLALDDVLRVDDRLFGAAASIDLPGQTELRDWSTGTEDGAEHLLTLHVWSRTGVKKQVHDIIEAIKSTLHDQPLTLVDHELVNLRHEFSEARPDPDGYTFHGIVRYRAVTEPSQAQAA